MRELSFGDIALDAKGYGMAHDAAPIDRKTGELTMLEHDADKLLSAIKRRYKTPRAFFAHLGLDEDLLDNPSTEQDNMDADQVIEGLKAAIADMDEEERYRLMEMLSELIADEDSVPPAGVTPTAQDRRRLAQDARLARHFASPRARAIDRALSASAKGAPHRSTRCFLRPGA